MRITITVTVAILKSSLLSTYLLFYLELSSHVQDYLKCIRRARTLNKPFCDQGEFVSSHLDKTIRLCQENIRCVEQKFYDGAP